MVEIGVIKSLKQYIHRYRAKKYCSFGKGVTLDSMDRFEGMNALTKGVTFLNSTLGYASYIGDYGFIKNTLVGRYTCIGPYVATIAGNHPLNQFASIHPCFYSTMKQSGFSYVKELPVYFKE